MKMSEVIIISGSPSATSSSEAALYYLQKQVEKEGLTTSFYSVRDVSPEDLFYARFDSKIIQEISKQIQSAKAVIIGSPVYKASYSGVLKALLDLLPEDVFQDTPVLPIMVGGSQSHLLAVDFAFKPLLSNMKGELLRGVYVLEQFIQKNNSNHPIVNEDILLRLESQVQELIKLIHAASTYVHH